MWKATLNRSTLHLCMEACMVPCMLPYKTLGGLASRKIVLLVESQCLIPIKSLLNNRLVIRTWSFNHPGKTLDWEGSLV